MDKPGRAAASWRREAMIGLQSSRQQYIRGTRPRAQDLSINWNVFLPTTRLRPSLETKKPKDIEVYDGFVRRDKTFLLFPGTGPRLFSIHCSTAIGAAFTAIGGAFASFFGDETAAECGETCF